MVQVTLRYPDSDDTFMITLPVASLVALLTERVVELHNLRQRIRALCELMRKSTPTHLVTKMLSEANTCIGKEQVAANVEASPVLYTTCLASLRELVQALFSAEVSNEAKRILAGEQVVHGQMSVDGTVLWWAKKELVLGEKISAYVGTNERTKLFVTVASRPAAALGSPAFIRAPVVDPHKEAYLNAKAASELAPPPMDDDDDTHNAPWARSSLKNSIRGTTNLGYRVEEY